MTPRYTNALIMAAEAHEWQKRKSTDIPYITHPVAVAALVAHYGGDEDQQIGALLHDVIEDGGDGWSIKILERFGRPVWDIVIDCTDGAPDATGKKAPWLERKTVYLEHLENVPDASLLVSACDKLHNITAIHDDLMATGPGVFDRFSSSREQTLWYYRRLAEIFTWRNIAPASAIAAQYQQIIKAL